MSVKGIKALRHLAAGVLALETFGLALKTFGVALETVRLPEVVLEAG